MPGQAYTGTGYAFDNEATLLYSEIDPDLHAAVKNDDYGPGKGTTSTINYTPKYFLINGQPYPYGATVIEPVGSPGTTLLRLLNAGLTTHVPMISARTGRDRRRRQALRFGGPNTRALPVAKTWTLFIPESVRATRSWIAASACRTMGWPTAEAAFLRVSTLEEGRADRRLEPTANPDTYNPSKVTFNSRPACWRDAGDSPIFKAVAATGATSARRTRRTLTVPLRMRPCDTPDTDTFKYNATDGRR
jgi:hypothetical protein